MLQDLLTDYLSFLGMSAIRRAMIGPAKELLRTDKNTGSFLRDEKMRKNTATENQTCTVLAMKKHRISELVSLYREVAPDHTHIRMIPIPRASVFIVLLHVE